MRPALVSLALLVALAESAPAAGPAAPVFEVALDETSITVGDPVTVTARLRLDASEARVQAEIVGVASTWGEAEVLEAPRPRPELGEEGERVWTLRVTAFRPGRIELPPLEVRVGSDPPRTLVATPVALEVVSVLPAAEQADVRPEPPAPARSLPFPAPLGWTLAALATALVATAVVLARRSRPGAAAVPAPAPLDELERALGALAVAEPAPGHVALSASLRRYLGRRLGFPALESTTTEVARRLAGRGLEADLARRARRLLVECDAVKFAHRPTDGAELAQRIERGIALAREVESGLAPASAESART